MLKTLIPLTFILTSSTLMASVINNCVGGNAVFFINGIWTPDPSKTLNDPEDSQNASIALREHFRSFVTGKPQESVCVSFSYAYNETYGRLNDLVESLEQLNSLGDPIALWWLAAGVTDSVAFDQMFGTLELSTTADLIKAMQQAPSQTADTIDEHLKEYATQIAQQNKIILVGHSQGNLFANQEFPSLLSRGADTSVIAVATPASDVAGKNRPYTSLREDAVAAYFFPLVNPSRLDPVTTNSTLIPPVCSLPGTDACHAFTEWYLVSGSASEQEILTNILQALRTGSPSVPSSYTITDLGTLPGSSRGFTSCGTAINALGQVAGNVATSSGPHAFFYTAEKGMSDIGTLPSSNGTTAATGINSSGQVIGWSNFDVSIGSTSHAFIYKSGFGMTDLGTLPSIGTSPMASTAYGIDASGQVTGVSMNLDGNRRAFVYTPGSGMQELGTIPGASEAVASAINDSGQITGSSGSHVFLYTQDSGMKDLGVPAGYVSAEGKAINASGQITGRADNLSGYTAFVFSPGIGFTALPPLADSCCSYGTGINGWGQVVGSDDTLSPKRRPFLYTPGRGTVDLNTVIPGGSGWVLDTANAINDAGQIAGCGIAPSGVTHAFLLTPQ